MKIVLLDAGPLGFLTNPDPPERERLCQEWATDMRRKGACVYFPQGAEYEVRRSLIYNNLNQALAQLDLLVKQYSRLGVSDDAWLYASELWSNARLLGIQPTDNLRLDFDTLLAAQAHMLGRQEDGADVWIATDNLGHLAALYSQSDLWENITP